MVDHRSTGLPECGPTESSAPEPCYFAELFRNKSQLRRKIEHFSWLKIFSFFFCLESFETYVPIILFLCCKNNGYYLKWLLRAALTFLLYVKTSQGKKILMFRKTTNMLFRWPKHWVYPFLSSLLWQRTSITLTWLR